MKGTEQQTHSLRTGSPPRMRGDTFLQETSTEELFGEKKQEVAAGG